MADTQFTGLRRSPIFIHDSVILIEHEALELSTSRLLNNSLAARFSIASSAHL